MKLLIKIFHNFFLRCILIFIILLYSKPSLTNNETPILDRLPTSIFATVNDEAISIYDLILRAKLFSLSAKIKIDNNFSMNILPELISGLIDEKIQSQEITRDSIFVPEEQVNATIRKLEKDNGLEENTLEDYLKDNGSDITILEKQIETSIGWRQLVSNRFRKTVVIQENEVERIHNNLKSNVGKDEFLIHQIYLSFENKNQENVLEKINNLYDEISKGGDFLRIADQFSDSVSGKIGNIGWAPETDIDNEVLSKIKKMETSSISPPLKGEIGYYIIKLIDKRKIGEELIDEVSLFQLSLIDESTERISELEKINNCNDLEKFSEDYGTTSSGSLGFLKFRELSNILKKEIRKLEKNEISQEIIVADESYRIMICDIKKISPIIPSKFKIEEILMSRKLETISRQYMNELRAKAVIDIKM